MLRFLSPRRRAYKNALRRYSEADMTVSAILYDIRPYDPEAHKIEYRKLIGVSEETTEKGLAAGMTKEQVAHDKLEIMGSNAALRLAEQSSKRKEGR